MDQRGRRPRFGAPYPTSSPRGGRGGYQPSYATGSGYPGGYGAGMGPSAYPGISGANASYGWNSSQDYTSPGFSEWYSRDGTSAPGPKRYRGMGPAEPGPNRYPLGQGMGPSGPRSMYPSREQTPLEKKRLANFELRKAIMPKSSVAVLNEILGSGHRVSFYFEDPIYNAEEGGYTFQADCMIEGQSFTGYGSNKQLAKSNCAEAAIQSIVSKNVLETCQRMQKNPKNTYDDTPWAQLASLGLFKLFNEWAMMGYDIPMDIWRPPDAAQVVPLYAAGEAKLPENHNYYSPVQVLNELKPGLDYRVTAESANKFNPSFTMAVTIDDVEFEGKGRSKKEAKKVVAIKALKEVFNITAGDGPDSTNSNSGRVYNDEDATDEPFPPQEPE